MKALITGIAGFAGCHLARALDDAGWDHMGIDLATGQDARDFFLHCGGSFDLVLHCAAVVGGRALIDGPPLALASNLELDAGLFQWAERTRPRRVVYFSSSAAYPVWIQNSPRPHTHSLREDDLDLDRPGMPDQLYGWAKLTGEMLATRARAEGVNVTVTRTFSGYGEDQGADYPFGALAARAKRRDDPFVIWGTGEQARDFIHIDDVVAAILTLVRQDIDGPVNIGTGRATTMRQLAGMMCAEAGYEPTFRPLPEKPSGVAHRVADVTLMNQFYTPKITLEEGVKRVMACG